MSKEQKVKYFIQTWLPVWSLDSESGVPIESEDPDAFFEKAEDAESEIKHNMFLQPENIYRVVKVVYKDGEILRCSYEPHVDE